MAEWYQINECDISLYKLALNMVQIYCAYYFSVINQMKMTKLAMEEFQQVLNITLNVWLEGQTAGRNLR